MTRCTAPRSLPICLAACVCSAFVCGALVWSAAGCAPVARTSGDLGYDVFSYRNINSMQIVRISGKTGEVSIATTDQELGWIVYPELPGAEPESSADGPADRYLLRAFNWQRVLYMIRVDSHSGQVWYRVALDQEPWLPIPPTAEGYSGDDLGAASGLPLEERVRRAMQASQPRPAANANRPRPPQSDATDGEASAPTR